MSKSCFFRLCDLYVCLCLSSISANVLEIHSLELPHDLAEVGSTVGIIIPAALHQVKEGTWGVSFRDFGPEAFFDDTLTDDLSIDAVIRWLACRQLPHNHAKRKHISLFSVLEALDHFWGHPLVCANLACHDLCLDSGPAKVGQFCGQSVVKQDIETFQISVQDGLLRSMEIVHAFCNVECKLLAIVPCHLDLHVVEETPKRASSTVLQNNTQVRLSGASTKEENNIGMSNDLHNGAFIFKFLKLILFDNFAFDFFDSHNSMLPSPTIDDTVATF